MKDSKSFLFALLSALVFYTSACKKSSDTPVDPVNKSAADQIAGFYNGSGKYLPGGLDLGNTVICTAPPTDYNSLYQTGSATVDISKLTDSTVKIVMSSGPFPQDTYSGVLLKVNGSTIEFNDTLFVRSRSAGLLGTVETNSGSFDPATKTISFSRIAPGYSYSYAFSCFSGLPYYASFSVPDANTGLMVYANTTIKRYVFSGTKK